MAYEEVVEVEVVVEVNCYCCYCCCCFFVLDPFWDCDFLIPSLSPFVDLENQNKMTICHASQQVAVPSLVRLI